LFKAEWEIDSTLYFVRDTSPYCKDLARSLELFANFKPEGPYSPNRVKEKATMIFINSQEKKINSEK
jgi:hypothetical protein